jgi:hypothetical protein
VLRVVGENRIRGPRRYSSLETFEMRATSVGPDLFRCHSRIEKPVVVATDGGSAPAVGGDGADAHAGEDAAPVTETELAPSAQRGEKGPDSRLGWVASNRRR